MKKFITFLSAILLTVSVFAQSPEKMSYQAVIRNSSNQLVTNQAVGMKISIVQGSISGTPVYVEIFNPNPTTNANGLVTIEIGGGVPFFGSFATIDWSAGIYFIKTEIDPVGGTNYTITGTSQLLSVPYALHAKSAESVTGGITETDPLFVASPANEITSGDITNWNNKLEVEQDSSLTNEIQALSISNDTVFLSNGGFVKLPAGFDGSETDPIFTAWDKDYNDLINKPTIDSSVTNEIQALSISNDTVFLSNGGFVKLPKVYSFPNNFYLGQDTLGGIVFYIYIGSDGQQHGLIVSKTESTGIWGGSTLVGADRTEDGAYNTNLMPTGSPAKTWVTGLGVGWYLPSIDELSLLWHNRFHVNKTARAVSATLLSTNAYYWSSTEYNATNAYTFLGGGTNGNGKSGTYYVRAVRAF